MELPDFYTVVVTLAPVLLAAGLFACRKQLKSGWGWTVVPVLVLLVIPAVVNFVIGLMVLGELRDARDTDGLRMTSGVLLFVQFAMAAGGFVVQAVGDKAARRKLRWRR